MSDREKAINIIDSMPDSQMGYILGMLQTFKSALDEAADDVYCERLYEDYLADNDSTKNDAVSIEDFAKGLGINL